MRFALIDAEKAEFPVRTMCRVLDVSESGFFSWKGRPASQRQRDDMIYLAHIRIAFELSNRTYGSPRMHRDLVDEGLSIGRRRTARLMRENGLAARQKRRFKRSHGRYARLAGRAQSAGPGLRRVEARRRAERVRQSVRLSGCRAWCPAFDDAPRWHGGDENLVVNTTAFPTVRPPTQVSSDLGMVLGLSTDPVLVGPHFMPERSL